ncbi:MAG: PEP-CTERM sorting domain-containing protein [Bryobacteraceae bacterium]
MPEPSTALLILFGLLCILFRRKRKAVVGDGTVVSST